MPFVWCLGYVIKPENMLYFTDLFSDRSLVQVLEARSLNQLSAIHRISDQAQYLRHTHIYFRTWSVPHLSSWVSLLDCCS